MVEGVMRFGLGVFCLSIRGLLKMHTWALRRNISQHCSSPQHYTILYIWWSSRDIQACFSSSSQVMLISHLNKSSEDIYCREILYKYDHTRPLYDGRGSISPKIWKFRIIINNYLRVLHDHFGHMIIIACILKLRTIKYAIEYSIWTTHFCL